jgi:biopolymer transport protein TolQ
LNADLSLLSLFTQASVLVQLIMLLLLAISIFSWSIIFQRKHILGQTRKLFNKFQQQFYNLSDMNRLYDYLGSKRFKGKGIEQVFRAGYREFARLYKQEAEPAAVMEGTERAMRVALAREEQRLEQNLPFLATVGSLSVYIGLFGTVWGIMTAFRALGQMQQATLAMVAPGISEALVATALGLFAAIPAVFAFNRYSQQAQNMMRDYDNLSEEFVGTLHRRLHSPSWQVPAPKESAALDSDDAENEYNDALGDEC